MGKDIDDIDLIFKQKLLDAPSEISGEEWKRLSKTLSFKNFFRFSFSHINIYYISIFSVLFASAGVQFVQNHRLKSKIKKMELIIKNKPQAERKTEIKFPENTKENTMSEELARINKNTRVEKKENTNLNSSSINPSSLGADSNKISSNPSLQANDSVTSKLYKSTKIVKKTIFIKNTPVIIRDTVIKHKRFK